MNCINTEDKGGVMGELGDFENKCKLDNPEAGQAWKKNEGYNCVMGDDNRPMADILKEAYGRSCCVVGNNNTVNVPDKTQQFETRCWELFVSLCGRDEDTSYDVHLLDAIETVGKFEAKMKEIKDA